MFKQFISNNSDLDEKDDDILYGLPLFDFFDKRTIEFIIYSFVVYLCIDTNVSFGIFFIY